jgi:outer membrane cobalamin receptor
MAGMPAAARDGADTTGARPLTEVLVVASRTRVSLVSPVPAQRLAGQYLESLGSLSVADAVRYFSGVQLKDYGGVGGLKTVNVRSLGSAHTAVFYDGMHVGNAQNGQVDLSKFSMDNIEEIDLYNGQEATIFQPARGFFASHTLLLKSRTPRFRDGERFRGKASFKTGSFGLLHPSLVWQQRLSAAWSLSADVAYLHADGKYPFRYTNGAYDTTLVRRNSDVEAVRGEVSVFASLRNGQAMFKAYLYRSARGLPGSIAANRFDNPQRQKDRNIFVYGSLQKAAGERYKLLVNARYSHDYTNYYDPQIRSVSGALDNHYYQQEGDLSLVNQYTPAPWCAVSLATDVSVQTMHADLYRFVPPARLSLLGVLSGDFHWQRLLVQASVLTACSDDYAGGTRQHGNRKILRPAIAASFQPFAGKDFRIRAFYKESFRMPTFNDIYCADFGSAAVALQPEYTAQYDAGVTWLLHAHGVLRQIAAQADVYYSRVRDKIIAQPSGNLFRWTMMNMGEVEIRGLEWNATATLLPLPALSLHAGLNYTFQQAVDMTPRSTSRGGQIPYTPVHSGSAVAALQWKAWQLNYSFIYTGERYSLKDNIPANYLPPWYTSDVAVGWRLHAGKSEIKCTVEVNNLFNQYYDVIATFPMPGRSYRLTVELRTKN